MARKEFSKKTKRDAFLRANGHCEGEGCTAKLSPNKFAYDHIDPDGLTGEPTLENCQVLCDACHKVKTKLDVKHIAQAKRREDASRGIRNVSRMNSAPFAKAPPQCSASRPLSKPPLPRNGVL